MGSDDSRVSEPQIQKEMLRLMSNGEEWENGSLKKALRKVLPLSGADKSKANCRENEEKWEELVNNALTPTRGNSLVAKGFVETVERGRHRITEKGRKENERNEKQRALLKKWEQENPEKVQILRNFPD
ncbi:MAG: winged helix-turn-helix domain-containing protein [Rhodobacteraceae bacterium]|nr:winged helix-turn-helix domain-containing protein [Paracoccaceae bacterium]